MKAILAAQGRTLTVTIAPLYLLPYIGIFWSQALSWRHANAMCLCQCQDVVLTLSQIHYEMQTRPVVYAVAVLVHFAFASRLNLHECDHPFCQR